MNKTLEEIKKTLLLVRQSIVVLTKGQTWRQQFSLKKIGFCSLLLLSTHIMNAGQANIQLPLKILKIARGVDVWFLPTHELPMVDVELVFDAGSVRDGTKSGLAYMTNQLVSDGCGTKSQGEVARGFEQIGAQFNLSTGIDMASIHLRSLTDEKYLRPAIKLSSLCLAKPRFSRKGISRLKSDMALGFAQLKKDPVSQGLIEYRKALYKNQPYGQYYKGNSKSIAKMTRTDIQKFYKRYYTQKSAKIVIVGDLTIKQARALARTLLGHLQTGKVLKPTKKPIITPPKDIKIHMPLKQTTVILAHPGVPYGIPHWPALVLGNDVLGGGMTSRLFTAVREDKGYAYSVHSIFSRRRNSGSFFVLLQSRNKVAKQAEQLAMSTVRKYVDQGPTEHEINVSRKIIQNQYIRAMSTNKGKLAQLAVTSFYGYAPERMLKFIPEVGSATLPQVKQVLTKVLGSKGWTTITVGPK